MGFSRQRYWSGLSCPPPEDLSNLGIELASRDITRDVSCVAHSFFTSSATYEARYVIVILLLLLLLLLSHFSRV